MKGWAKITAAANYAGVSTRTFRNWLQQGLKHSRLPSRTILVRLSDIDEYLDGFAATDNNCIDRIVNEVCEGLDTLE